jgi:hypothetical protein
VVLSRPVAVAQGDAVDARDVEEGHGADLDPGGGAVAAVDLEHHRDTGTLAVELLDLGDGFERPLDLRRWQEVGQAPADELLGAPAQDALDRSARVAHVCRHGRA